MPSKRQGKCHKKITLRTKQVNYIGADGQEDTPGDQSDRGAHQYAFRIGVNSVNTDDLLEVEVGGVKLQVLADSGAYSNIVDEYTRETLKAKKIKCTSRVAPQNKRIYSYASENPLDRKEGTFECEVKAEKVREKAECVVVRGQGVPLLGKQTATKLRMLKVGIDVAAVSTHAEQFHQEFPVVFTGL